MFSSFCTVKPVMSGDCLIVSARGSIARAKMRGESGQPCLVPFDIGNCLEKNPEEKTVAEGQVYKERIASYIGPVKPNLWRTFWRYSQLTLSKAFSASKERRTESIGDVLAIWIRSSIRRVPSLACLPRMNPTWSEEIKSGRILFTLFANNLEKNLISLLRSEMGRQLAGSSRDFPGFGNYCCIFKILDCIWLFHHFFLHFCMEMGWPKNPHNSAIVFFFFYGVMGKKTIFFHSDFYGYGYSNYVYFLLFTTYCKTYVLQYIVKWPLSYYTLPLASGRV